MSVADKLLQVKPSEDIKEAIENKDVDLTGVARWLCWKDR